LFHLDLVANSQRCLLGRQHGFAPFKIVVFFKLVILVRNIDLLFNNILKIRHLHLFTPVDTIQAAKLVKFIEMELCK
jgi:hypothetical protein